MILLQPFMTWVRSVIFGEKDLKVDANCTNRCPFFNFAIPDRSRTELEKRAARQTSKRTLLVDRTRNLDSVGYDQCRVLLDTRMGRVASAMFWRK